MASGTYTRKQRVYFSNRRARVAFILQPAHWFYALVAGVCCLLAYLPYRLQLRIGHVFGKIAYATGRKYRHSVDVNLRLCFPALNTTQRLALAKAYFCSAGVGIMEVIMAFWRPRGRLKGLLHVEGLEHLEKAYAEGRGVILLSAHFTLLELGMRLSCENIDLPLHLVYKKQKNAFFNYLWIKKRRRYIDTLIAHNDIRQMLTSLKNGAILCYVPDQDFGRKYEHVFAPLFGVQAATITSTSRLAAHRNCPVMLVSYQRLAGAKGYKVIFHPPLAQFPTGDLVKDATIINHQFETMIRDNPSQYFWHHRRFKTRPRGEPRLYKKIRRKYI